MINFINILIIYFKIVIFGKKHIKGYELKYFGNLPLVNNHHFMGYEIINNKNNKVVYRKTKDFGIINRYNSKSYNTLNVFFYKNAI